MRIIIDRNKVVALLAALSIVFPLFADIDVLEPRSFASFFPEGREKVSDSDHRKAEYLFLEAMRCIGEEDLDRSFDILRYARTIDPSNTVISDELGKSVLALAYTTDRVYVDLSERLRAEYYREGKGGYIEAIDYATLAQMALPVDSALAIYEQVNERYPNNVNVLYPLANLYDKLGRFEQSIETYNKLEAQEGRSLEYTAGKAVAYMSLNDTTKCLEECRSLLATAPENVTYNLFMSDIFKFYHKPDSVDAYFDRAERLEPDNGRIYLKRADYYHSIGDTVNYDKQMYKALINKELTVDEKREALLEYSVELVHSRDSSDRAVNLFKVLVDEHPHEFSIRELFAEYLWTMEDYSGAAEQLQYALDIEPANPEKWRMLVYCYANEDRLSEAQEMCIKALTYNENDVELMRLLGILYAQDKKYDKAQEIYDKTLAVADKNDMDMLAGLYELKGDAYYQSGDTVRVLAMYEKALEYAPDRVSTLNNYAYNLACMGGDLNKAEQMSYRTIMAEPENPTYLDTYAWILFCKANYKEALLYMEKVIEAEKKQAVEQGEEFKLDGTIKEHYGDILFMNARPDEALEQWKQALADDPDNKLLQRKVEHKTYFFK